MKTLGLILIVVALHCAAVGALFFISGCGTTSRTEAPPATPVMPSPKAPAKIQPESLPPSVAAEKGVVSEPTAVKEKKTAGGGEYIVQAGDSIASIAKRCHVTKAELIEANKLSDPNKLKVGQKLILPAYGQVPAAVPKPAEKTKAAPETVKPVSAEMVKSAANEYVVKPGDNLSKIAAHFGVRVSALREANQLPSDKLKVGQKLIVPEEKKGAPTAASAKEAPSAIPTAEPTAAVGVTKGTEVSPVSAASTNVGPISSSGIVHVVQPNEDLSSIAKLYAVTADEIVELNQLSTNRTVRVGQRLKIP